jgi:hypothetical protein
MIGIERLILIVAGARGIYADEGHARAVGQTVRTRFWLGKPRPQLPGPRVGVVVDLNFEHRFLSTYYLDLRRCIVVRRQEEGKALLRFDR